MHKGMTGHNGNDVEFGSTLKTPLNVCSFSPVHYNIALLFPHWHVTPSTLFLYL